MQNGRYKSSALSSAHHGAHTRHGGSAEPAGLAPPVCLCDSPSARGWGGGGGGGGGGSPRNSIRIAPSPPDCIISSTSVCSSRGAHHDVISCSSSALASSPHRARRHPLEASGCGGSMRQAMKARPLLLRPHEDPAAGTLHASSSDAAQANHCPSAMIWSAAQPEVGQSAEGGLSSDPWRAQWACPAQHTRSASLPCVLRQTPTHPAHRCCCVDTSALSAQGDGAGRKRSKIACDSTCR
jgi:hypothetical protein